MTVLAMRRASNFPCQDLSLTTVETKSTPRMWQEYSKTGDALAQEELCTTMRVKAWVER